MRESAFEMDLQEGERRKRYVQTVFLLNIMIYRERMQKNPCLSVEYIYNRRDNVFYTVISYGDKKRQWICIYER